MLTAMWIMFGIGAFAGCSVTLIMGRQLRLARQEEREEAAGEMYRLRERLEWAERELEAHKTENLRHGARAAYQAGYRQGAADAGMLRQGAACVVR